MIQNARELLDRAPSEADREARRILLGVLEVGLEAVDPERALRRRVRREGEVLLLGDTRIDLRGFREIVVLGGGKASAGLARALVDLLGSRLRRGLVIVPEGAPHPSRVGPVDLVPSTHPLPSERGQRAVEGMLELVPRPTPDRLVFCLISGGGSALMPLPREGITLADKVVTTDLLLASGAPITEINAVRKHLSAIKGGGLARRLQPATIVTLVVSDVPGNMLDAVASGPTVPDPTTFEDALGVLERRGLLDRVPAAVLRHLRDGVAGRAKETPKPGDGCFRRSHHLLVSANEDFLEAARAEFERIGCRPVTFASPLEGDASEAGRSFAEALDRPPGTSAAGARFRAVLAGGETTVRLTGRGEGGRNQEAALAAALRLSGPRSAWAAFLGTDGVDGPTPAAGALADAGTIERARARRLDPEEGLRRHESHPFFRALGDLILTGPTGTNVGDVALGIARNRSA